MGINIIGGERINPLRIQFAEKRDADGARSEPVRKVAPVGEQHTANLSDNDGESDSNGQAEFVDPGTLDSGGSGDAPFGYTKSGRVRNRPVGSATRGTGNRSTSKTTDSIASMLFTVHSIAASMLKLPSLRIPKEGAAELAAAIVEVTELYEVDLLSDKQRAWGNLAIVASKVYFFNDYKGPAVVVTIDAREETAAQPLPDFMVNGSGRPM